ncbi:hypothetical protein BN59_03554 [Legionella massiliensis]|uniref:Uncharacterized protein n=1 Tax=Legionella massiliensis TaxID=1034943 RepID=A0A078L221_9GAMM|nr:hypothetical protein [Legionella massiliensis]CDZ79236.1 hypothetical protein BN59_03554 [Legionella massiliensis]CEE14974.1 hypothetical protein BN1094_03554 [Legionella massiliensis]
MKKLIVIFLLLGSSVGFTASVTDLSAKWICTTNASTSDAAADKAADDKMANTQGSAAQSFAFAAQNCRDCTKITCEAKD